MVDEDRDVVQTAQRAKAVTPQLRSLTRHRKDEALLAMAAALRERSAEIVAANADDVLRAEQDGTSPAIIDRLTLTEDRVDAIASAVADVAGLPDPVGEVVRGYTLPNGLQVRQLRVPLGVVGMIYEARPNVTVDAAGRVVVTEKAGPRAKVYGAAGELLAVVAERTFDPGAKNMDVAVDSTGRIYVADTVRLEVRVFRPEEEAP